MLLGDRITSFSSSTSSSSGSDSGGGGNGGGSTSMVVVAAAAAAATAAAAAAAAAVVVVVVIAVAATAAVAAAAAAVIVVQRKDQKYKNAWNVHKYPLMHYTPLEGQNVVPFALQLTIYNIIAILNYHLPLATIWISLFFQILLFKYCNATLLCGPSPWTPIKVSVGKQS